MRDIVDIGGGWKAMEVKGLGVIVEAGMGLTFVPGATIDEEGSLVAMPPSQAVRSVELRSDARSGLVAEFLAATDEQDLTSIGRFGPLGPTVKKLRDTAKLMPPGSSTEDSLAQFLATGNHLRYGPVAALLALDTRDCDLLAGALNDHGADLEALLDSLTVGNVAASMAAWDESTPAGAAVGGGV